MRYRPMSGAWARACDARRVVIDGDYARWAVVSLGQAMVWATPEAVERVEYAGAQIRAWRKSLPVQGERLNDYPTGTSDDDLLWAALREAVRARLWSPNEPDVVAEGLRAAEAALRTWWKRQEQP